MRVTVAHPVSRTGVGNRNKRSKVLKWMSPLPTMANQKKTDYICISKESEGPAPDTLDETLPVSHNHADVEAIKNLIRI